MRRLFLRLSSLALAAAAPGVARAQDPPGESANRVVLDVIVKDKNGVIGNLTPEEFRVSESGSRRPIERVRFVRPGEGAEGAPGPGSLLSLVFTSMAPPEQKRARRAVEELLRHDLDPNIQIGVFRLGLRLWTVEPFTNDRARVLRAVDRAASHADASLAEPDAASRKWVADTLASLATGRTADPAAVARAEVLARIMRQGDRLLRQQQADSPLYLLMALAKGQAVAPGRKTVVYLTGGLSVPGRLAEMFAATQSEANRAHVSFYAVDVGGLDTSSEAAAQREALEEVARASREQNAQMTGPASRDQVTLSDRVEASTRTNWKQPLRELSEATGGFAVLAANDYRKPMARLVSDLTGHYEVVYRSARSEWDGAFRRIEVEVARGGARVQGRSGYLATPPDEAGPVLAYEMPLIEALEAREPRRDFTISVAAFSFTPTPEGRETTLVAELPTASFEVRSDAKTRRYKLHFALLALVRDAQGEVVERVSQDYPLEGPEDALPQVKQGHVVFRRQLLLPPGQYTLELAARDRASAATSVHRGPLVVPEAQGLAVSSVVIVRRMEPAPPLQPGAPEDPLRGEATRIVPSLDDPVSKASTAALPIFVVVYPLPGGTPPQMALEFSAEGRIEGRNSVTLPPADPDGRIRFLASVPIARYAPGRHEVRVLVRQGEAQAVASASLTLAP